MTQSSSVDCDDDDDDFVGTCVWVGVYLYTHIAQFAITINSNVCPHIRVPNMLMRNPMHDVVGIFNSEARY